MTHTDGTRLAEERLRSNRLTAPAPTITAAATHMLATQAQEFWGGRWALAVRTKGEPTLSDVDAAFGRGEIVRSWTMRGTLHIIPPCDLAWVLSVTAERQAKQFIPVFRSIGLDDTHLAVAERAVRAALSGGNRVTRAEFADVLRGAGIDPGGMRSGHLISALSIRGILVWGPVVERAGAPTREQHLVLAEDWIRDAETPGDPLAEFYVRYLVAHGPAGPADFAWWASLPLGTAREAAERAGARIVEVADGLHAAAGPRPRRTAASDPVLALPPFEEYYLSYADRTQTCAPEFAAAIGPSMNGIVQPILVARGVIAGVWSHSVAVGKHHLVPQHELFAPGLATEGEVVEALARYHRFISS